MACLLGCDSEYEISISYRGGGRSLGTFEFSNLTWERTLDTYSEARVEIPTTCCAKLTDVRAWAHELHISRDGEEVWVGPVAVDANCRGGTVIIARDMLWWLNRRVIHNDHIVGSQGAVLTARDLIRDGFLPDDPNVLQYLQIIGTGVAAERNYPANSKYVLDALTDLGQGSIDFTTVGRRIVVMPEGHALGRTALLTCDSFQGDLCTTDDGLSAATRAVVTGTTGVVGSAGGVDPYFGLVEVLVDDDTILTDATAAGVAAGIVAAGNPPPVRVQPPEGAGLAPDAPVCMSELVPGVTVPVIADCTCRTIAQDMRLVKVSVTVDSDGEKVGVQLVPIGTDVAA